MYQILAVWRTLAASGSASGSSAGSCDIGRQPIPVGPPINRILPCQSSSRAFSKAPCCWLSLAGVISGLSMSSWHMERSFHVKGSGLCEKITRKIQPNKFLSACHRWLWMWVVLRKKITHLFKWERWLKDPLYRLQHNWMLGIWYKYCQYISASDWDFKKGYPEINAFKAVLPTVEDILLLLLYFGRCIIAAWFHNLPPRWTLQKWNSNKKNSLMMEFQQFPASENLWKSNKNFLTTNHPALKGFCTNDKLDLHEVKLVCPACTGFRRDAFLDFLNDASSPKHRDMNICHSV